MQLPPVHTLSLSEYFVSGNVIIHETAVVAPGVILEAALGYQITVGAGVCLGLGSVITAHQGNVDIQAQAAIAPGVLIIGPVIIGDSACIGARTTIFQQDVQSQSMVAPGSLLMVAEPVPSSAGEHTKPMPEAVCPLPSPWDNDEAESAEVNHSQPSQDAEVKPELPNKQEKEAEPVSPTVPEVSRTKTLNLDKEAVKPEKAPVVGQVYINQLLLTLFPERRYFNS